MTKTGSTTFLLLFFLISAAYAQKVKYKDIFALLSTKQYEQAEPFLKRYLKDNDDNPNAYLYMAIIFQEKAYKIDVLKQTASAIANMDSSILFYDKAYKLIDEREVRKNKEYYQAYNRRDLRTGEFGVKLSDIQFDIEKKKEALKERIDRVKMVKHYFSLADSLYSRSNTLYRALQRKYVNERQLYLRADQQAVADLKSLVSRYDSCMKAIENYKTSASNLGKIGYNQVFTPAEITSFAKDGDTRSDFYKDEVTMWDYRKFANNAANIIEKEIMPMREHLVSYDVEINKLRDRLNSDSVSVKSDLTKLIDKLLYDQLRKYDPEPLPMEVFSLKTADLEYRSALLEDKPNRDSADVHLKLAMTNKERALLHRLDSVATKLGREDIDEKALDYNDFIQNTYGSAAVLKSYVTTLKEYADHEKARQASMLAQRSKALQWIVDGTDSIPLSNASSSKKYRMLFTADEKYTLGLHLLDSANSEGYFYTITAARRPDVKVLFPVDKAAFRERKMPVTKSLSYADAAGQIFFVLIYSEQSVKEKHQATLAKIYRSDGLAWANNYPLSFVPREISFRTDTGEVTLKGDAQQAVVDKNGKLVR